MLYKRHIIEYLLLLQVRVGIKLLNELPYLSRVRLNFETLPEVQMTVRPLFTHGVNVSDIPLVAGWMVGQYILIFLITCYWYNSLKIFWIYAG